MRKLKNEQGVASVILIVLLIAVAVAVYGGVKIIKKPVSLPEFQLPIGTSSGETGAPTKGVEPQISPVLIENFDKTGNLTDWDANAEKQTGDWILLYEEPGRSAIVANLVFSAFSRCNLGNGEEVCDKNKLELGAIARVQGDEKNGVVTVIKLTKIAGP